MHVSEQRLREDVESTAEFGSVPVAEGRARTVLTGTDADRRAREYFASRLHDAGLDVSVDAVGNVVGRWIPQGADPNAAPVAAGSHLDSVPNGGIFDGPLGVFAALESVRAMQDAGVSLDRPVDVVCLTEEEGQRFDGGLIGSAVAAGELPLDEALAIEDGDGIALGDALDAIGFQGDGVVDASEWHAWVELHVEQARRLESAGVAAGVVTAIAGVTRCQVEFVGEANHAGTTVMDERTDALAAASEFVVAVERAARECTATESETAVATVGEAAVSPNAPNVIPGHVALTVDVRDVEYRAMEHIVERIERTLDDVERERGVETRFERPWNRRPVAMSDRCRTALQRAGADADVETRTLHSGAAHDTMHIADVTDAGMLFAPSRDGTSHNPLEWTDWSDCAAATQVMAGALRRLASS